MIIKDPEAPSRIIRPLFDAKGNHVMHPWKVGMQLYDPASLKGEDGGDPVLVMADGKTLQAVRADHAAELLLPESHRDDVSRFRLATNREVEEWKTLQATKAGEYRAMEVARIHAQAEGMKAAALAELKRMDELNSMQQAQEVRSAKAKGGA